MRLAVVCLLLSSCGPVMLGEEHPDAIGAAGSTSQPAMPIDASTPRDTPAVPSVAVHIKPVDCGKCFELQAEGSGGQPPYAFEWEDGSQRAQRLVCVDSATLLVIAKDAAGVRSAPQAIQLQRAPDAACPQAAQQPNKPAPRPKLCLKNPSFEGTPAANFGQEQAFDAAPWSTCTNPEATGNTPDIGNDTVAQTLGVIPKPTEGNTFLALGEGEQVSQAFCSALPDDDEPVYLQLDLTRMNIGAGLIPETEQVFLEIWGGLSVDCSRRELLWASPPLEPSWKTFCVPLRPRAFLTQLTLRAAADMSLPSPAYLLVDNLKPVEACP